MVHRSLTLIAGLAISLSACNLHTFRTGEGPKPGMNYIDSAAKNLPGVATYPADASAAILYPKGACVQNASVHDARGLTRTLNVDASGSGEDGTTGTNLEAEAGLDTTLTREETTQLLKNLGDATSLIDTIGYHSCAVAAITGMKPNEVTNYALTLGDSAVKIIAASAKK